MTADEILDAMVADYATNTAKWLEHTKPETRPVSDMYNTILMERNWPILDPIVALAVGINHEVSSNMFNVLCAVRLLNGAEFWDLHPDVINLLAASGNEAAILMQEAHRVFNLPNERTP